MNNKSSVVGLEIIGDLSDCDNNTLMSLTCENLKLKISTLINKYTFTELGSYYHQFDVGITGVIALAESHIAFHTWPNERYVSLNVFICNYSQDNSQKTQDLFQDLLSIFESKRVNKKIVNRHFN